MFVIARELKGGPPNCEGANCSKGPPRPVIRVMLNEWADFRMGDPWLNKKLVKALGKALDSLPGESSEQYVALWYQCGEPVMGRIWNDGGKITANFAHGGNEYKKDVGSLQTSQCNYQKFDSIAFVKLRLLTALVILVRCLEWILQKMILIYEKTPMIYNAARFCYEKPDVTKDLIRTSLHLAYVSYQNGLWTLSDAFDAFFGNSIGKMNELEEKADEKAERGGKSPNSPTKSPATPSKAQKVE
ncbi:unnamed protein product, partial [Mesorhabditis belari]|uniref:Uncharacterized protein n=1 Tax=Mesorhabditis belari TaxID=2138241 RepID=A0AAF3F4A3_9BILA